LGLFSFLKKKKPETGAPPPEKLSFEQSIPPPEGPPAGKPGMEKPMEPAAQESKHVDDLGFPTQPAALELPPLEFPEIPEEMPEENKAQPEKITLKDALGKPEPSMYEPEMEKEEPSPAEIPELDLGALKREEKEIEAVEPVIEKHELPTTEPVEKPQALRPVEEMATPEEPIVVKEGKGPLFINLLGYKNVLKNIDQAKKSTRNADSKLMNANNLKNKEDSELEAYHSSLENIQRKLMFIDKMLFEKTQG